jgi:hypothetical protein
MAKSTRRTPYQSFSAWDVARHVMNAYGKYSDTKYLLNQDAPAPVYGGYNYQVNDNRPKFPTLTTTTTPPTADAPVQTPSVPSNAPAPIAAVLPPPEVPAPIVQDRSMPAPDREFQSSATEVQGGFGVPSFLGTYLKQQDETRTTVNPNAPLGIPAEEQQAFVNMTNAGLENRFTATQNGAQGLTGESDFSKVAQDLTKIGVDTAKGAADVTGVSKIIEAVNPDLAAKINAYIDSRQYGTALGEPLSYAAMFAGLGGTSLGLSAAAKLAPKLAAAGSRAGRLAAVGTRAGGQLASRAGGRLATAGTRAVVKGRQGLSAIKNIGKKTKLKEFPGAHRAALPKGPPPRYEMPPQYKYEAPPQYTAF